VNVASAFKDRVGLSGIVLTRVDGDARGGAALSMRAVTGCPIKLIGVGEKLDALEGFHPDRVASRILGMGDVVSLVEKAAESFEQEEAEKLAKKLQKGTFDLDDFAKQLQQMQKMGGLSSLMGMLPGMSGAQMQQLKKAKLDDGVVKRQLAMLSSMTPTERQKPDLIKASRKQRIASGSGTSVQDVNKLLKQHKDATRIMKRVQKMGKKGMMRGGLGGLMGGGNPFG
jgi:signal recognition particle subunit SRP54